MVLEMMGSVVKAAPNERVPGAAVLTQRYSFHSTTSNGIYA